MTAHKNLTRRGFVGGAAGLAAASLASGALAGLAVADEAAAPAEEAATETAAPASDEGLIASAQLNPQDYDYRSNSITDFTQTTLFSPWKFGSIELSHRMVKSAAGSDTQSNPEEMVAYYSNFAKGGVEMVWVEDFVDKYEHFPMARGVAMDQAPLKEIADAVHEAGGHIGYQILVHGHHVQRHAPARQRHVRLGRRRRHDARRDPPAAAGLRQLRQDAPGPRLRRGRDQRGRQQHRPVVLLAHAQRPRRRVRPPVLREPRPLRLRDGAADQGGLWRRLPGAGAHQRHRGERLDPGRQHTHDHGRGEPRDRQDARGSRRQRAARAPRAPRHARVPVRERPVLHRLRHRGHHGLRQPVRLQAPLAGQAHRQPLRLPA